MAITNSVLSDFQSENVANLASAKGLPQFQSVGLALSGTVQQTNTLTLPASLTFSRGIIRVKVYNPGSANLTVAIVITASDGTNGQVILALPAVGFGTGVLWDVDIIEEFLSEFNLNSFNVLTTLAGLTTTATLDFEVVGTL